MEAVLGDDLFRRGTDYFDGVWTQVSESAQQDLLRCMAQRAAPWPLAELEAVIHLHARCTAPSSATRPTARHSASARRHIGILRAAHAALDYLERIAMSSNSLRRRSRVVERHDPNAAASAAAATKALGHNESQCSLRATLCPSWINA